MKKRVLITGSSGMLGLDLCQELSPYYTVYGIDLVQRTEYREQSTEDGEQSFSRGDVTDGAGILKIILKIKPDVVIHTAAWTDVDGCELDKTRAYKVNSQGTKNIVSACNKNKAILIYISTDFVFDGKKKLPYKETDSPKALSVYGDSKLRGEEAVMEGLKRYFIIRTSWLYGKFGRNFVDTIMTKAKSKKELKVVDDQAGSPTYTKDLAKAIHALLGMIRGQRTEDRGQIYGIYHVSNSGSVSWYKYAKEILKIARSGARVLPISSEELSRPARRPAMSILDNSKFVKFTGYRMRSWKDALKEYMGKHERMPC